MKRRHFTGLAAAAFLCEPSRIVAEAFDRSWNLGIITDQVDLDLRNALRSFFPRYQLRWAEIRYLQLNGKKCYAYADSTPKQLKEIKQQLDDAGVRVSVLDTAVFKVTLPGTIPVGDTPAYVDRTLETFERQMDDLRRAAAAAHILGSERIRIFTFRRVAKPENIMNRILDELQKAIDVAKKEDVTLLVENEYDCNVGTAKETSTLFRAISDKRLMHNWDPCNGYEMKDEPFPKGWHQLDHSRISHIHLKDALGGDWKPIGAGEVNFVGLFRALKEVQYAGTMSVETRFQNEKRDQYASSVESMDGLMRILENL
jgi:sugar phosphate isomerase/epimerase